MLLRLFLCELSHFNMFDHLNVGMLRMISHTRMIKQVCCTDRPEKNADHQITWNSVFLFFNEFITDLIIIYCISYTVYNIYQRKILHMGGEFVFLENDIFHPQHHLSHFTHMYVLFANMNCATSDDWCHLRAVTHSCTEMSFERDCKIHRYVHIYTFTHKKHSYNGKSRKVGLG